MGIRKKFIFFCIAGASGALVEIASFNAFFLALNFTASKALSLAIAITLNFTLNRNITFNARSRKIIKQLSKHMVVYSIAILFNFSVSLLAISVLGPGILNANIAALTGIVAAVPITFLGSLHWTFKPKH